MKTWKNIGIFAVSAISLGVVACGGSDGAPGAKGDTGAAGAAGAKGDPGDATPKSVGVIVPNVGLQDRELDVTITTNGVDLTKAAPTVDLGAGATVSNIQVLSATTLYAHVAVDVAAATGARDVKVTEGSDTLTATKAFKVAAPIVVTTAIKPQQGGFLVMSGENLDAAHAFADSFDPFSGAYDFFSVGIPSGGGQFGGPSNVTATRFDNALILLDPLAPASVQPLAANLDPVTQNPVETFGADPISVASRAPTAVTLGTPLTGQNLATPFATNLYKYNTTTVSILEITTNVTGGVLQPDLIFYGPAGTIDDLQAFNQSGTLIYPTGTASTDAYITFLDSAEGGGAATDYGYDLSVVQHTATAFTEGATAHTSHTTAQAVTPALPAASTNNGDVIVGTLSAAAEDDWYSVALTSGDTLEISGNTGKEILVDMTDGTETSLLGGGPLDNFGFSGGNGVVTQSVGTTGTYYIHVSAADASTAGGAYLISLRKR